MKRFWDKVEKTDTCWNWTASVRSKQTGYGCLKYKGKVIDAHRFSWFLTYGKFSNKLICHKCDNRLCVKPSHLFEGTHLDNSLDAQHKGRLNRKYFTKEEKLQAKRTVWLRAWHKRGKFRREERNQERINKNIGM